MKRTIALVSAFPPSAGSLNEYGLHLAKAFAVAPDVAKVIVIADMLPAHAAELDLGPKVEVRRVWSFNSAVSPFKIVAALKRCKADAAIYNVQTATFGDREIPAALGLFTPSLSRLAGIASGVIAHNIIEGIDLENTILKGNRLRQAVVRIGAYAVSRGLTGANWFTTTLDAYHTIYSKRFPAADIAVVPHGAFDQPGADFPKLDERPHRIVTMGKFGTYKKLDTLLAAHAMYRTLPGNADCELVIGGTDHPNTPGYMAGLKAKHDGKNGIRFVGYVSEDDVPEFFSSARYAVFDYSATTGSSGVLHQATSFGAVPVFPHIGDFVELCEKEGLGGEHYDVDDATGMCAALMRLRNNGARAQAMATRNFSSVQSFTIHDVARFHLDRLAKLRPGNGLRGNRVAADTMVQCGKAPSEI